jgi:hypothetical protein
VTRTPAQSERSQQAAMQRDVPIGPDHLLLGDDSIGVFRLGGTLKREHAEVFVREVFAFQDTHPRFVLLVDFSHAEGMDPEARKLIIAAANERPYPVGFIRASFAIRTLLGIMLNATRLLGKRHVFKFLDSEAEGRAWAKSLGDDAWIG